MDHAARINQANGRLKLGKVGLRIEAKGDRLYLRGTLPPRPGSSKPDAHQQRLATGIHANPKGISEVERIARKIGALLDCGEFTWDDWMRTTKATPKSIKDWIDLFEKDYFARRARTARTETTWKGDYMKAFRLLPVDQDLTIDRLIAAILETPPDTKSRKRACMAIASLANFASVPIDASKYAGTYSPKKVTPRNLPGDDTILNVAQSIHNTQWLWVYGMIATYGLRPHEVFRVNHAQLGMGEVVIQVMSGKTGARKVWPFPRDWVDRFDLHNVRLPPIQVDRPNESIGRSIAHAFGRYDLPFTAYDLRHAWAIRTMTMGLDISLAARQMGHSVAMHSQTYHAWISEQEHQAAYERIMQVSQNGLSTSPSPTDS
jgi:integrase